MRWDLGGDGECACTRCRVCRALPSQFPTLLARDWCSLTTSSRSYGIRFGARGDLENTRQCSAYSAYQSCNPGHLPNSETLAILANLSDCKSSHVLVLQSAERVADSPRIGEFAVPRQPHERIVQRFALGVAFLALTRLGEGLLDSHAVAEPIGFIPCLKQCDLFHALRGLGCGLPLGHEAVDVGGEPDGAANDRVPFLE